jgi:hypothetical protein
MMWVPARSGRGSTRIARTARQRRAAPTPRRA